MGGINWLQKVGRLALFSVIVLLATSYTSKNELIQKEPQFIQQSNWADSVLESLTIDEKIGQLFMVAAYSNRDKAHEEELNELIEKYRIGGLIFFQGGPVRQAHMTNRLQNLSNIPLLIGMDAEWGAKMRLDSMPRYPRAMMVAASRDSSIAHELGRVAGEELKTLGVHVSFSPVLDVNNNPNNPVINSRSFGEKTGLVAEMGIGYYKGLQEAGVIAVGKHFPGHGDTDVDSHVDLPVVNHDENRLETVELLPFKAAINEGIPGMMVAHLSVPVWDKRPYVPSSLSDKIVQGKLRDELGFNGLIFTDALNMKGVTKYYKSGDVEVQALIAGNDVLLFPEDVKAAVNRIKQALKKGKLSEQQLDNHVKRILQAKEYAELTEFDSINVAKVKALGKNLNHDLVNRNAHAAAITLVYDNAPEKRLLSTNKNIVSIALGDRKSPYQFQDFLKEQIRVSSYTMPKKPTSFERELMSRELDENSVVILSLHDTKLSPSGNFGITKESLEYAKELSKQYPTILVHFGNPYALSEFTVSDSLRAILVAFEEGKYAQRYAAEALVGAIEINGKLPVSINGQWPVGTGINKARINRFHFSNPEIVGMSESLTRNIDSIAEFGIDKQAYPGCQIVVVKKENVIHQKSYGYHTYENLREVKNTDLYDLASITKIASSVACAMYLDDHGMFSVEKTLGDYLPEYVKGTEYEQLVLKEILTHQAGLVSWIPFYQNTMSKGVPRYDVYSLGQSDMYPYRVAENFYIHKNYPDSIVQRILDTPLHKEKTYRYSDLGYYFLQLILEKQSGVSLEQLADSLFYLPMSLSTTGYLPRNEHALDDIVPTEYDVAFRKQLIHGDVHDPGAAMMGGVGGHAGLFSSATDLAKLMQVFLTGSYGGEQFLSDSVRKAYTTCLYCADESIDNRRAIGFDKPVTDDSDGPTCHCISLASFGHTGFTGTIAWADPETEIIYVFLSNRVYPDAQNRKLIKLGIRTEIMQTIYDENDKLTIGTESESE